MNVKAIPMVHHRGWRVAYLAENDEEVGIEFMLWAPKRDSLWSACWENSAGTLGNFQKGSSASAALDAAFGDCPWPEVDEAKRALLNAAEKYLAEEVGN